MGQKSNKRHGRVDACQLHVSSGPPPNPVPDMRMNGNRGYTLALLEELQVAELELCQGTGHPLTVGKLSPKSCWHCPGVQQATQDHSGCSKISKHRNGGLVSGAGAWD